MSLLDYAKLFPLSVPEKSIFLWARFEVFGMLLLWVSMNLWFEYFKGLYVVKFCEEAGMMSFLLLGRLNKVDFKEIWLAFVFEAVCFVFVLLVLWVID